MTPRRRSRIESAISRDPAIQCGKPCIRGTRIRVSTIKNFHGSGFSADEIREEFPSLTVIQIEAAIAWGQRRSIPTMSGGR